MVDILDSQISERHEDFTGNPVLCVDLDGTLLRVDTLHESFLRTIRSDPVAAVKALGALRDGRAAFKRRLVETAPFDAALLPLNDDLVAYLESQHAAGRRLALVSAADQSIVDAVAARLPIFEWAIGSDGKANLSGAAKLTAIRARYGDNFAYAGNAAADLPIWAAAKGAVLAGGGVRYEAKVAPATPIEGRFPAAMQWRSWLKALRPHQWAKNLLVFVPYFLAGPTAQPGDLLRSLAGFAVLSLLASTGYLLNDLLDLEADRAHPSKRRRPFASGALSAGAGVLGGVALFLVSLVGAAVIGAEFAAIAMVYFLGTLTYSLFLKRIALLDVMTLAGLYTVRIRAGIALVGAAYSYWIITFSIFIFLSLALLKRYAEFVDERLDEKSFESRGYSKIDVPLILGFGIACSVAAPLLFVIYLVEERFPAKVYSSPEKLWLVTPVLLLWLMHMWRAAVRGLVREDPVIFALKDKVSLALGAFATMLVAISW